MFGLPALLAIYPDALFLQTHRAPLEAITSVASLITILRRVFSDAADPVEIGRKQYATGPRRSQNSLANEIASRRNASSISPTSSSGAIRSTPSVVFTIISAGYYRFGRKAGCARSWQNNRLICRVFIVTKQRNLDCAPNTNRNFSQSTASAFQWAHRGRRGPFS